MRTSLKNHNRRGNRASSRGFSLVELMVVVTMIGILAAIATPSYQRAVEQAKADIAGANLRAIWAAERLYWLEYRSYTNLLTSQTAPNIGLVDMGVLDQGIFTSGNYTYTVPTFTASTFTAQATSPDGAIEITINESGIVTSPDISLGFQ